MGGDHVRKVALSRWNSCLIKQTPERPLTLFHVQTEQEGTVHEPRRQVLTRHPIHQHLDLGLPASDLWEIRFRCSQAPRSVVSAHHFGVLS